jgi:hypothetical protein
MNMSRHSRAISGAVVALLMVSGSGSAFARGSCQIAALDQSSGAEVNAVLAGFGAKVVAIGRIDAVSRDRGVQVLGMRVMPAALESYQVGDYAAVIDWSRRGAKERILEVRPLESRYIPGVSEIYLKSKLTNVDALQGQARLGVVTVDFSNLALTERSPASSGSIMVVRGTQPQPKGLVLGRCVSVARDGSLGTGRTDGSLGTGRADGSLGTGRAEGSLGTGRTDGSLGTGKTQGSLGTGRLSGSLGTGRTDGSLGTGRTEGSLGTGRADGSLGTGRVDGSLGTGRSDGSLGTGKTQGSLGTGRLSGSLGTGRADGSLGTGRADGSLGTGRAEGSLGTGRLNGSLGTGRTDGSLGTGRVDGSLGTGRTEGSLGTGRTQGSLGTGKSSN